jgi:hypothetical protein
MIAERIREFEQAEAAQEFQPAEITEYQPDLERLSEEAAGVWKNTPAEALEEFPEIVSGETQYDKGEVMERFQEFRTKTDEAVTESKAFRIETMGDGYFMMLWAAEFAREWGVNMQLFVSRASKKIMNEDGSLAEKQFSREIDSALFIDENTTEEKIRNKVNEIMISALFFYDGELYSDKRDDFEFRFVAFDPEFSPEDIPVFVKAGAMNCMLKLIYDNIREHANGTKFYNVYDRFVNLTKKLGDKGFDIRKTGELLGDLPFDFEFHDRHSVVYSCKSKIKNRENRKDIKKLRVDIENEHAKVRNMLRSKDVLYIGDEEQDKKELDELRDFLDNGDHKDFYESDFLIMEDECRKVIEERNRSRLLCFAEYYGLDVCGRNTPYPFIIGDREILKTYRHDDGITPTAENVKKFLDGLKKTAGQNVKYRNYEKYWRRARFTPIMYRSINWDREIHTKIDGCRMYLQALERVRIPQDTLEHYNLDLNEKESAELVDILANKNVYGFAFCEYDEFDGPFRRIWRKADVYEISIIKMLAEEGFYPKNIRYIAMTRKYLDRENFDMDFCRRLRKGPFNSMIGALFKRRRVRTQYINCQQDYHLFMAHMNNKEMKVISEEKTGVKVPLDSNDRHHHSGSFRNVLNDFNFTWGSSKKSEKYFEQRVIQYKIPKSDDWKPSGLPSLQTAITNIVAFNMCKLEKHLLSKGVKIVGCWGDGLTYVKSTECENILQEARNATGFDFKYEWLPENCDGLVKTKELLQRERTKFLPLESSVPRKFIYDIEAVLSLENMLLEGPGGSGKTHFLKSLCGELENVIITSSKQKTARDIGGQTVQKLCSYYPSNKDNLENAKVKQIGKWSVHTIKRGKKFDSDRPLREASYVVLDECYVSPKECTDKVIDFGGLTFYTGDKFQKTLVGEELYDFEAKYKTIGRPLKKIEFLANMRFKKLDGARHDEHFEMLNDLRTFIGTEADPELIPVDEKKIAISLAKKNRACKKFIADWAKKYNLNSAKYSVRKLRPLISDKDNNIILSAKNDYVDEWNKLLEPEIQVGSKIITQNSKENGIIAYVSEFLDGKNNGTDKQYVSVKYEEGTSGERASSFPLAPGTKVTKKIRLDKVKLFYSTTIDKSQGSTYSENVILDCRAIKDLRTFYVGLSRCRYPENLRLIL